MEERIQREIEEFKKRMKQERIDQERIDKSWKEERERQERVKKEEYEQFKLMQQKVVEEEQEIIYKSWKEERERQDLVKKEEEKEHEKQRLHQEKVERELRTMDEFELDHQKEIIRLICIWNNGKSLESYIQCDRKSPRYWYKIAPELREEAVKIRSENVKREQKILTDRENPDSLLVINDLHAIDCISEEYEMDKCWDSASESELLNIALKELNVEIIKRIVRKTYPHKFA